MICLENKITVACERTKLRFGSSLFLHLHDGRGPRKHLNKIQRENFKTEAMASGT